MKTYQPRNKGVLSKITPSPKCERREKLSKLPQRLPPTKANLYNFLGGPATLLGWVLQLKRTCCLCGIQFLQVLCGSFLILRERNLGVFGDKESLVLLLKS